MVAKASAAGSSVVVDMVAAVHRGDIEAIPALDLAGTSLAAVLMVEAIAVVVEAVAGTLIHSLH